MTRAEVARKLLALGRLSFGEFVTITGWPRSSAHRVLSELAEQKQVRRVTEPGTNHRFFFELAS